MDPSYASANALVQQTDFSAQATAVGVVQVSWSIPVGQWNAQRLVRSSAGYALAPTDGIILLAEDTSLVTTSYTDSALPRSTPFVYYTLLLFDVSGQRWVVAASDSATVVNEYDYTDRQYRLLPAVYKSPDLQGIGNSLESTDTSLYRFLSVFGWEFDYVRSILDSLLLLRDPQRVLASFLPAALADFNLGFEPELGVLAMRRWLANAARLTKYKGTTLALQEVTTILTNWPAAVLTGKNLALDNPTAQQNGGIGLWGGTAINAVVSYYPNNAALAGPIGSGLVQTRISGYNNFVRVGAYDYGADPVTQSLQGIPVTQGETYCASMYHQASAPGVSIALRITWINGEGTVLSTSESSDPPTLLSRTSFTRSSVYGTAPVTASFALVDWIATSAVGFVVNDLIYSNGFQFEIGTIPTTFECARKTLIVVTADAVNYALNPTGTGGSNYGWEASSGTVSVVTPTSGSNYFTFTNADTANASEMAYSNESSHPVEVGDVWSVQGQAMTGAGVNAAMWCAATLRLYYRGAHVRDVVAPWSSIVGNAWTTSTVSYTVSSSEAVTDVVPAMSYRYAAGQNFVGGETLSFRRMAMEDITAAQMVYVDGSMTSNTNDYLWGGAVAASPSYYYSNRAIKAARLQEILPNYLPYGACFDLVFAYPPSEAHGGGLAIENYNLNSPSDIPQFALADAVFQMEWNDYVTVGASFGVEFDYMPDEVVRFNTYVTVGSSFAVEFNEFVSGKNFAAEWNQQAIAGASLAVEFITRQTVSFTDNLNHAFPGNTPDGQAYSVLAGTVNSYAANSLNVSDGSAESAHTIIVAPLDANGTYSINTTSDGASLYFRVSDANNWWRVRYYTYSYTYLAYYSCSTDGGAPVQSSTDESRTYWYCQTYTYTDTYPDQTSTLSSEGTYGSDQSSITHYPDGNIETDTVCTQHTVTCTPQYGTAYVYEVFLDKCVNGTVSTTNLSSLNSSTSMLKVVLSGSSITVSSNNGTAAVVNDPFNSSAANIGFGSGPNYGESSTVITSFTANYTEP